MNDKTSTQVEPASELLQIAHTCSRSATVDATELIEESDLPPRAPQVAEIAVEGAIYSYDSLFYYLIPSALATKVKRGVRVSVPFGRGVSKLIGMVFEVGDIPDIGDEKTVNKLKTIAAVIDSTPVLNEEQLKLATWLKDNTFCTYFDAVKSILPAGLAVVAATAQFSYNENNSLLLSQKEKDITEKLKQLKSQKELNSFISRLESDDSQVFNALIKKNVIERSENYKNKVGSQVVRVVKLAADGAPGDLPSSLTPKQRAVLRFLEECESASIKEVCYNASVTTAVVNALIKKNVLIEYEYEMRRTVVDVSSPQKNPAQVQLSAAQQQAYDGLRNMLAQGKSARALLRGITGSGKTMVFIKLIEYTLSINKTALLLVPEIALTPQMTGNFTEMFGDKVAIVHSGLSIGQRADEYKRIKEGSAKIVIGTRSAVFSPLEDIGIIVIDEEGEHSYKSDKSPRYHARDVAKHRATFHNALLLLASATPSLDSYHRAKTGQYRLFELEERFQGAILPDVYIIDMKAEPNNRFNFSMALLRELDENLRREEQSMVLLNRRGYHTFVNCIACGDVLKCQNCELSLTYHKANNTLQCHYCGFRRSMPDRCEKCRSKFIRQSGTGTQRIEEELRTYFPRARILRMDADTTMTKRAYETNFKKFGNKEFDIMVGTQMIAKGLDFENVTLVGILHIDKSLYAGDYLGYERTFSLITQVVGRSGRGEKKGRAYLQTFTPDHYVLELAASQNYKEFYEQEIAVRKSLIFPPLCDIFLIGFIALSEEKAYLAARRFIEIFATTFDGQKMPIRLLGPTKIGAGLINGKHRQKLIIKTKNSKTFREVLEKALRKAYKDILFKNVSIYVDINGEIL
ncbi:MAG: primosomal protein N' [Oscillospiraceae bacterium]|nr:primosomal protein N' [Oscillospiraceae bacterium]